MTEEKAVQTGEIGIISFANNFVQIFLRQIFTDTMENHVVIKRVEMVTGNNRSVFKRGKIFFPRHTVDNQNIFLDQL